MKFIDSIITCKFRDEKRRDVLSDVKFWIRAFEKNFGILIILSKVERLNSRAFDRISDVLANKFFRDLEVGFKEFIWVEHFPESIGSKGRREQFSNIEFKNIEKRLVRVGKHRVFLEQIEHLIGEELQLIKVLDHGKKTKINMDDFE